MAFPAARAGIENKRSREFNGGLRSPMTSSGPLPLLRNSSADGQTRFKDLLDGADLIAVMVNSRTQITYCNTFFLRLSGWTLEELDGRPWREVFASPSGDEFPAFPTEGFKSMPTAWHCEEEIRIRSGERRSIRWNNILLRDALDGPLAVAGIGEDITERKKLERALADHGSRERGNLEKALHDGLGQELAGIALLARSLATTAERDNLAIGQDLARLATIASDAIESCRRIARGFSPLSEMQGGLIHALRQLTITPADWRGPSLDFAICQTAPLVMSADASNHVYRLAQEWLTSSMRHSAPQSIVVNLNIYPSKVSLEIRDDGSGPPASRESAAEFGVRIAQHRARLLDAELHIESGSPRGTRMLLTFSQPI
jgi:PAS domain S-box-containing protein